ncbi:MAG: glycosyltransferase family 4 protein [Chloroflexi bacterium]|nr:glycosyltransferase family 4 protein [Chloroflexota bacterium]
MRIALNGLFLAHPATGTGQYLRELVSAMRALAPEDEFAFIAPHADASAPAPVLVTPTRLKRENFAKLEFEHLTFPRAAKQNRFDLAHVPHFGPPLFPALPTVVTIHDLIPLVLPAYRGSARVQLYTRLAAQGARRARAILADSQASARDIEKFLHIPRERIQVVYLAAHARFQPNIAPDEIARVRAQYNLPERFVLYLGGFDVRKNVARIIEAFASVQTGDWRLETGNWKLETGNWKLVIAGNLPERDSDFFPDPRKLAEKFRVTPRVHFPGFIAEADKPALYAAARVFLFGSQYEGFGLPPLEALACGTPVICAHTSSLPEVVGDAGILLAPDDARAWRDALRAVLRDDAQWAQLRALGLVQARKFSWERAARETLDVYRSARPSRRVES